MSPFHWTIDQMMIKKKKPWKSLKAQYYNDKGQNRKSVSDPARV